MAADKHHTVEEPGIAAAATAHHTVGSVHHTVEAEQHTVEVGKTVEGEQGMLVDPDTEHSPAEGVVDRIAVVVGSREAVAGKGGVEGGVSTHHTGVGKPHEPCVEVAGCDTVAALLMTCSPDYFLAQHCESKECCK